MKIYIKITFLLLASLTINISVAAEDTSANGKPDKLSIVIHDEIIINRSVPDVWKELRNFAFWYFDAQNIKQVKGDYGRVGYTLLIDEKIRNEIISVRPLKGIVWKTCLHTTCEEDYIFSDMRLQDVDGKTRFIRTNYSQQGFFPEEEAKNFLKVISQGKVPDSARKVSLAFKKFVEKKASSE